MEMEHEPIRVESSSDRESIQPITDCESEVDEATSLRAINNQLDFTQWGINSPVGGLFNPVLFHPYAACSWPYFSHLANQQLNWYNMGHGASHLQQITFDGEVYDVPKVKLLINHLRKELQRSQDEAQRLRTECLNVRHSMEYKDAQINKLTEEVDKLKCVLQQKLMGGKSDILATIQEDGSLLGIEGQTRKKQGVSGECSKASLVNIEIKQHKKDVKTKHLIKSALKNNDFLKNLDKSQVHEIVNCMHEVTYQEGEFIIRENEAGNHFYVSAEGLLEVSKGGQVSGHMGPGRAFGELAILYDCKRTASIKAAQLSRVWALERTVFKAIMMRTGLERQNARIEFLRSVPTFRNLSQNKLAKIVGALEVDLFEGGEHIVREGQVGDTFYIIAEGEVSITQKILGCDEPQEIRRLKHGDYFGERALLNEERRTASVMALKPGVELLTLNRDAFISHIGDLKEFHEKDYGDMERRAEWRDSLSDSECEKQFINKRISIEEEFKSLELHDLEIKATLGTGGFGRVELVQIQRNSNRTFALKCLKKKHIVDTRQVEHVYNEKNIMLSCSSPFIVRLHRTFKDRKFVYMLMEVCLGGELWTILRDRGHFDDHTARFCVACVLEAFQYLHPRGIVYRDLKPENLLVTENGYIKLVDFGFAKHIPAGQKTWTFCGTPEYIAPEIIQNRGHDHAVDIWATGILIYELTTGIPPFTASDPMSTYNNILSKGIDGLDFPRKVSKNAQSLIKRLCRENPSERLGYQRNGLLDIMKHKWFQGFDWEGLRDMTIDPPFKQKVQGPSDACNFDRYPNEIEMPPDELSGWDDDF